MLYAKVIGTGLPVVLIHGYCEDHTLWHKIALTIAHNYQATSIDLPGFGRSKALTTEFTVEDIGGIVHRFISDNLGLNQYVVVGHSLGGYIGLAMADAYPKHVIALGLINSSTYADTEEKKSIRSKTADFIKKNGVALFLESFVKNLFTLENQQIRGSEMEWIKNMGRDLQKTVLVQYMLAMRDRPDRSHLLNQMDHLLFVAGLQDIHVSQSDIKEQVKLLKSNTNRVLLEDAAHMAILENEQLVIEATSRFLRGIKIC